MLAQQARRKASASTKGAPKFRQQSENNEFVLVPPPVGTVTMRLRGHPHFAASNADNTQPCAIIDPITNQPYDPNIAHATSGHTQGYHFQQTTAPSEAAAERTAASTGALSMTTHPP